MRTTNPTKTPDRLPPWPSGLVIVAKPGGMTSHDVVARVRRIAHTRRVGHAGTLDPMATGVLVIGIEKATRLLGHLTLTQKTYEATIRLGQATTTDDAEGEPADGSPAAGLAETALKAGVGQLTGDILQVPPGVSAIKVNGQRAYQLTRAGAAPELAARPVTVYEFTIGAVRTAGDFLDVDATVRCSSGTYIRALARDLGTALGTGGHLTALRRTAVGPYTLDQAHSLEDLEGAAPAAPWLISLAEAAAATFPRLSLTADQARRLAQGARLPLSQLSADPSPATAPPVAVTPAGAILPAAPPAATHAVPPATSPEAPRAVPPTEATPGVTPARAVTGAPIAAFAPDGTLVALVTAEEGQLRSLAVFAG
jgi:tRNA pseudouridine55 synthase